MSDKLSDDRLEHLIDFTSATSSEANSILCELKSLRAKCERLQLAMNDALGLARTSLKPDIYPDEQAWLFHKVNEVAYILRTALESEENNDTNK